MADYLLIALAIRYDGTNGAAVTNALNQANAQLGTILGWSDLTIVEDTNLHTITIQTNPFSGPYVLASGQWISLEQGALAVYDHPVFQAAHRRNQPNITTVAVKDVPAIAALGSANVDVNLPLAFSATNAYQAVAYLVGALTGLSVGPITKLDADTVRVRVDSVPAFTAGAQVVVVATGDPA